MMTKKHYELVAKTISRRLAMVRGTLDQTGDVAIVSSMMLKNVARELALVFATEDRRFDRVRFLMDCGLVEHEINMKGQL